MKNAKGINHPLKATPRRVYARCLAQPAATFSPANAETENPMGGSGVGFSLRFTDQHHAEAEVCIGERRERGKEKPRGRSGGLFGVVEGAGAHDFPSARTGSRSNPDTIPRRSLPCRRNPMDWEASARRRAP